jgi:hypothetical protein
MPIFTWIRDLLGIRKDYVDTKKSVLEIEKLEVERRERDLITPATLNDVKKYDPNFQKLQLKIDSLRANELKPGKGVVEPLADFVRRYPIATTVFIIIVIVVFIMFSVRSCFNLFR